MGLVRSSARPGDLSSLRRCDGAGLALHRVRCRRGGGCGLARLLLTWRGYAAAVALEERNSHFRPMSAHDARASKDEGKVPKAKSKQGVLASCHVASIVLFACSHLPRPT